MGEHLQEPVVIVRREKMAYEDNQKKDQVV